MNITKQLVNNLSISGLAAVLALVAVSPLAAADQAAVWNGGTGNWNVGGNWDIAIVPNNDTTTDYLVTVDAVVFTFSTATVNGAFTIKDLTVNSGDQVTISNGQTLTINRDLFLDGVMHLNSSGSSTTLNLPIGSTLNGSGQITTTSSASNRVIVGAGTLTLGSSMAFFGAGVLLNGSGGLDNQGIVEANGAVALSVSPGAEGVANSGILRGVGAGGLTLQSGTYTQTATGSITAGNGSIVRLTGASVTGGSIAATGTGTVQLSSNGQLTDLGNSAPINIPNGGTGNIAGTIDNSGTIQVSSAGSTTTLNVASNAVLEGTGEVVLGNSSANRLTGAAGTELTNSADHTIRGAGNMMNNFVHLINEGTIVGDQTIALTLNPGPAGMENNNLISAQGSGGITLSSSFLDNTDGIIEILDGSQFSLTSTEVIGGTIQGAGSGEVVVTTSSIMDGVTLECPVNIQNGRTLNLETALTNNSTVTCNSAGSATQISAASALTIGGTGEIILSNTTANRIVPPATGMLTFGAGQIVRGAGSVGFNSGGIENLGTIIADQATALTLDPNATGFVNSGTLRATGAGGLTMAAGNYTNTGSVIEVEDGSLLTLLGATVVEGALQTSGSGFVTVSSSPTLDTVNLNGDLNIPNGQILNVQDSIANNGTINLLSAGSATRLIVDGTAILGGTGEVILNNSSANRVEHGSGGTITLEAGQSIRGAGNLLLNAGGMINRGSIRATEATALVVDPSAAGFVNEGELAAEGSGGLALSPGTFTNTGNFITARDTSQITLTGCVVTGGTLDVEGTGSFLISGNPTLDGVILNGPLTVSNGQTLTIENGITNNGQISCNSVGNVTQIELPAGGTIAGSGSITLSNSSVNRISTVAGSTIVNGAGHTITGSGQLLQNAGGFTNQGTIIANQATDLNIDPGAQPMENQGVLRAEAGRQLDVLTAAGMFLNSGTIEVQTGALMTSTSTLQQSAGALSVDGTFTPTTNVTVAGGEVRGNGTIGVPLVMNGGAVKPGQSAGSLTVATYSQGASAFLDVETGGTIQETDYDLLHVTGAATIAGTLRVDFINGFNPPLGAEFIVMTFASLTGDYGTNIIVSNLPPGKNVLPIYNTNDLTLQVVDSPLLVDLVSFAAIDLGESGVRLEWETAAELDNAGFNLHRVERAPDGSWRAGLQLNAELLPPLGSPSEGAVYEFIDAEPLATGEIRGYFLEDIDLNGTRTLNGPAWVAPAENSSGMSDWVEY